MIVVKQILASETVNIRHQVLRVGKLLESCLFDNDDLNTTVHFGIFKSNVLHGVVSIFAQQNPIFESSSQFQMRGMAILPDIQGQGFGQLLLKFAENHQKSLKKSFIWFNARITAMMFYKKMGYLLHGEPFDIPNVGLHVLMYKNIP